MTAISVFLLLCLAGVFVLAMRRASIWVWTLAAAAAVLTWRTGLIYGNWHEPAFNLLGILAWVPVVVLAGLAIPPLRRAALIAPLFHKIKGILPRVSATEQEALNAGTIGFDAELFSGQPNWEKLRAVPPITLTEEEKAFLDGPTTELCRMVNDWMIRHQDKEIPEEVWAFVKKHGFLGMLISKEHGGLGFSPQAQSLVLGKIASRSPDAVTIVMVPNSLGPGELIEKYGTPEQKHYYLPRLAKGLEVPCFSLTGPTSGSDAATMRDVGYVTRGRHEGQDVVGIRVSWDKRYITLGPVATLVGLAFRLFDPENLLGRGEDIGITVALVPANHPGVNIGRRHLPSGTGFPNGPNWGKDVFIPMDWVIGGDKMAGQGWRMLMECLAAGRSISLPSSSAAGAKSLLRNTTRLRAHPQAVRPADRQDGGPRGAARAHGGGGLRQRGRARRHGLHGEPGREAVGDLGHHEVPDDRAHAPLAQRRHGPARRPRHLRRADELPAWRPTRRCRSPSRSKAPTSSRARSSPSPRGRCARTPTSTRRSRPARTPTRNAGWRCSTRRSAATSPSRSRTPSARSSTTSRSGCSATCRRRPTARPNGTGSCGAPRATSPWSPT